MESTKAPAKMSRLFRMLGFRSKQQGATPTEVREGEACISERALNIRHFKQEVYERLSKNTILSQLPRILSKEENAIDIGGNVGHIAYFLSHHCRRVYTYEAVGVVFDRLKEVTKMADNIIATKMAMGDYCGEADFFVDHERLSNSGLHDVSAVPTSFKPTNEFKTVRTRVATVDSLEIEKPGFIKIDVEGSELDVLRGAELTIAEHHPDFLVEIYEPFSKYPVADVFAHMFDRGYRCYYYDKNLEGEPLVAVEDSAAGVNAVRDKHDAHDGDFLFTQKRI